MKRLDQSGVVALLTVSLFATITTILVIAYAKSSVSQQQEALNYDLSNRAYYAAEVGVQDAVRALNGADPSDPDSLINKGQPDSCKAGASYLPAGSTGELGNNLAYTCQLITVSPSEIEGDTSKGSFLASLRPQPLDTSKTYSIKITWSPKISSATETTLVPRGNTNQLFPPSAQWVSGGNRIHPLVRTEFVSPNIGTSPREQIGQQVYFLNPLVRSSGREAAVALDPTATRESYASLSSLVQDASCYPNTGSSNYGGYSCQKTFNVSGSIFSSRNLYLRLGSVYDGTRFRITVEEGGVAQSLSEAPPIIEVTARANNVFRRISQVMPIGSNETYSSWPDGALAVGDGFCKLLQITNSTTQYDTECNAEGLYAP